jgi:hypothetical protein
VLLALDGARVSALDELAQRDLVERLTPADIVARTAFDGSGAELDERRLERGERLRGRGTRAFLTIEQEHAGERCCATAIST